MESYGSWAEWRGVIAVAPEPFGGIHHQDFWRKDRAQIMRGTIAATAEPHLSRPFDSDARSTRTTLRLGRGCDSDDSDGLDGHVFDCGAAPIAQATRATAAGPGTGPPRGPYDVRAALNSGPSLRSGESTNRRGSATI